MTTPTGHTPTPGFIVLHGNRLEDLRDVLLQFVQAHPLPPLEAERILVQSNGMKHWLELGLAHASALGICAATRLELPATALWSLMRQVLGAHTVPAAMPFDKSRLVWRLLRLLPELAASKAVYEPLQRYLGDGTDERKLYQLCLQLADVLDGYQSYRADWLHDWAQGRDVLADPGGVASPLPAAQQWQAELWRDLCADVGAGLGAAAGAASRASVHQRFMQALHARASQGLHPGERPFGLPRRLVVFGVSSLPTQSIEALAGLGIFCQVLMLVQNPSQYYWGDLWAQSGVMRAASRHPDKPGLAQLPRASRATQQPLLAAWGQQARDYLHLLSGFDQTALHRQVLQRVDLFVDPVAGLAAPTQLAQLQSCILNLEPAPQPALRLAEGDDSITLVSAHSVQREVEILFDQLLAWFEDDADLQPREVMVMVPDMAVAAPHIQAVFGRFTSGEPRHIPYSVADHSARQSPLVQALAQLLVLPSARISLAEWLGLFEVDAVRQRFELSTADVDTLHEWLDAAGVRWGLDANHRLAWGLPADLPGVDQNTWSFGLRRLLLGYALGPQGQGLWQATVPQAGLASLDAPLLGKLLNWVDAMELSLQALSREQAPDEWVQTMSALVERFFAPAEPAQERQMQRLLETLEAWQHACADAALCTPLPLQVLSDHWLAQLQDEGLQQRFFGGGVQFASLMPMRSIPFKRVCLLGMNDGAYPRASVPRDFDLIGQRMRAGDRSRREDDRYLFLEALLSARQKLYISFQGRRATDNLEQAPSVLLAQLMDFLNTGWTPERQAVQHPLQAFSPDYFVQGSRFRSFDVDWACVHQAGVAIQKVARSPSAPGVTSAQPLPWFETLPASELQRLLRQPVEVFYRSRLNLLLDAVPDAAAQDEPFALNALDNFQLGQSLLQAEDLDLAVQALRHAGHLPMGAFGERRLQELQRQVGVVHERREPWWQAYPHRLPAQGLCLAVSDTETERVCQISATLLELRVQGSGHDPHAPCLQLAQRTGRVADGSGAKATPRAHVLVGLWVNHVLGCAAGLPLTSVQLGWDQQVVFETLPVQQAQAMLQAWLQVYRQAWKRPLPLACKTGWAFVQEQASQVSDAGADAQAKLLSDAHRLAARAFEGDGFRQGSEWQESAYLARAFDGYADVQDELPTWAQALYGDLALHARLQATPQEAA
jgi:exodeoxyribonuclease V gamma subunit